MAQETAAAAEDTLLNGRVFEVRVKVGSILRSFHFERRTQKQAVEEANKHGKVVGVKKVEPQLLVGNIESLDLNEMPKGGYLGNGIFEGDIDIDRIMGLKKSEVRKRRDNEKKYKKKRLD